MNVLIAIIFSAVVVSAFPQPDAEVGLSGAVALAAAASASAEQTVLENASGHATILSINGAATELDQEAEVIQLANVDLSETPPAIATVQAVNGINDASAVESLQVEASADDSITIQNSGATTANGAGVIVATAETSSVVNGKKN